MTRAAPEAGTVLAGKYRVERAIGAGGMGVVVEATHVALAKRVAVKLLPRDPDRPEESSARLLHEARIAAQLPGEHIARALDFGETDEGDPFLVMELLRGGDLEATLSARGRLPAHEAVALVLQACEGVAEAHAVGLVHRDLKPANLFLTRRRDGSPLVKVLDFGIATWGMARSDSSAAGLELGFGTPAYMAPEQFFARGPIDARCDQHALAVVLYELVTGRPPFAATSLARLAMLVAKAPPPPIAERAPDAPRGLWPVIERALAKRPEDRYPDLSAFAAALSPFGGAAAETSRRGIAVVLGAPAPEDFTPPARTRAPSLALEDVPLEPTDEVPSVEAPSRRARVEAGTARLRRGLVLVGCAAALGACALIGLSLDPSVTPMEARRALASVSQSARARVIAEAPVPHVDEIASARAEGPASPRAAHVDLAPRRPLQTASVSKAEPPRPESAPAAPLADRTVARDDVARPSAVSAREVFGARR
jgi:serine/threonine-protein kinase